MLPTDDELPKVPQITIKITNIHNNGKCSRGFQIGNVFQYPKDRNKMCPSALSVLHPYLLVLAYGGKNIYDPQDPNTFSISCPDAIHPVVYKMTRSEN
ncbi:TIGR04076 family protein [Candidatus Hodarchaeum mangrovi]